MPRDGILHDEQRVLHRQTLGEIRIVREQIVRVADAEKRGYQLDADLLRRRAHAGDVGKVMLRQRRHAGEFRVGDEQMRVARRLCALHQRDDAIGLFVHLVIRRRIHPPLLRRSKRNGQRTEHAEDRDAQKRGGGIRAHAR